MTKRIQIDTDAFDRLEQARLREESVSEVIRRCIKPPKSAEEVLAALRQAEVSPETLDASEQSLLQRRDSPREAGT